MKAEITIHLAEKTRQGHLSVKKVITGAESALGSKIAGFVYQRIHSENFIKAQKFDIVIKDHENRVTDEFSYVPTYR